jgi:hypothetical protein
VATKGLSLVGAIDQQFQALHHLRLACVPSDPSDIALISDWNNAKQTFGTSMPRSGLPDIMPISAPHDNYIQTLLSQLWVQTALQINNYQTVEFKLIEIAPLLAYQFIVDNNRSDHHCASLSNPSVDDLLPICLPLIQPTIQSLDPLIDLQPSRIIVKLRNLNARQLRAGVFGYVENGYQTTMAGMQIHVALPFVHVVTFNGRYYLHNGYHRAYGAAKAGATHLPCLLRAATSQEDAGIMPEGPGQVWQTFPLRILEGPNPPTLGHFINDRACDVQVRSVSRVLHITWSESALPDEYERMKP